MALIAKWPGSCVFCGRRYPAGTPIDGSRGSGWGHATCPPVPETSGGAPHAPAEGIPDKLSGLVPSSYQAAARALVELGKAGPHILIDAVAGSGKSTTITWMAWHCAPHLGRAVYLAFNKPIATEIAPQLPPGIQARTLGSAGLGVLSARRNLPPGVERIRTEPGLARDLAEMLWPTDDDAPDRDESRATNGVIVQLVDLVRATLNRDLRALTDRYISDPNGADDYWHLVEERVPQLLAKLEETWRESGQVDFAGQLYLPVALGMRPARQMDTVMVDESQDLNACQIELTLILGKRIIVVGDPLQAIYGWRGADTEAMDRIAARLRSTPRGLEMAPLNLCYRCPTSHLEMVRALGLHPHIEPRPDAPRGTIDILPEATWADSLTPESVALILCRTNAPLASYAMRLIRSRIPCRIQGRDIGSGLVSLVKRVRHKRDGESVEAFLTRLDAWHTRRVGRLLAAGRETQPVDDQVETIRALAMDAESVSGLQKTITSMFRDAGDEPIVFSTVHRAKGLQSPWVIILESRLLPGPWATQGWEIEEERHIAYVAFTRSMDRLSFVGSATYGGRPIAPVGPEEPPPPSGGPAPEEGTMLDLAGPGEPTCASVSPNMGRACIRPAGHPPKHLSDDLVTWEDATPDLCRACKRGPADHDDLCAACWSLHRPDVDATPQRPDLAKLPTWPSAGSGAYVGAPLADWETIRDAYQAAGLYAELRVPSGWRQQALVIGLGPEHDADLVRVSTTVDVGDATARGKGANAIDVVRVARWDGPPLRGSRRKVLRTEGWMGRTAERINGILRTL